MKAQKSPLPRQAQAGLSPPSYSSDPPGLGGGWEETTSSPHPPTAMVTAAVTGNSTRFLASLTEPLIVTGGGDWTVVPAWAVWREPEDRKLWAPSPTPTPWDLAWLGLHIWQQKLELQACHLHKTTALSPKHFPICLLPALSRRVGQDN